MDKQDVKDIVRSDDINSMAIRIAKPFSAWEWESNKMPQYVGVIRELHKKINAANQCIINRHLKPVAPFSSENAIQRMISCKKGFTFVLGVKDDRKTEVLNRFFFRYLPIYYLSEAIFSYSFGISHLVNHVFSNELPYKSGPTAAECALLDFYEANSSLSSHLELQRYLTSDRDHASKSAKKAAAARHVENRETAERLKQWFMENREKFPSMDAAAEAAIRVEPVSFRTARKHIGAAAKELRSARKE